MSLYCLSYWLYRVLFYYTLHTFLVLPMYRLFASTAYCSNILRLLHSTRCVVIAGSFRISPLRQIAYHFPSVRIHCPIYMCGTYSHANYIYSFSPSMLHYLSADTPCDRCRCACCHYQRCKDTTKKNTAQGKYIF